jgi:hypothetical protein
MIVDKAVRILRCIKKKITEIDIIDVLDGEDFDDYEFEITDELIEAIMSKYNMPIDYEQEALREANRIFNQNVKGIVQESNSSDEDDWEPSVSTDPKIKQEWDCIQDKLDIIKQRYDQMTCLKK